MKKLFLAICLVLLFASSGLADTHYFVKDDGNDGNTGLSDAQAWLTLGKVNSTVAGDGDKVFLKCGDTWTSQAVTVDWANAYLGAYYDDGADAGETSDDGTWSMASCGTRPRISGNNYTYPSGSGQLVAVSVDSATVEYLNPYQSGWIGMLISAGYDDTTFQYNHVEGSWRHGIYGGWEALRTTIAFNEVEGWAYCFGSNDASCNDPDIYQAAIHKIGDPGSGDGDTIQNNSLHDGWGECINMMDYTLIEKNLCFNNDSVGINISGQQNVTVRFNVVGGTDDTTHHRITSGYNSTGIQINTEQSHIVSNTRIYGNIVFRRRKGIAFRRLNAYDGDGIYVYNNTLIDNMDNIDTNANALAQYTNVVIKNNYSWIGGGGSHVGGVNPSDADWTIDYNYWSSSAFEGLTAWNGDNDVTSGTPGLTKSSNWYTITDLTEVDLSADFFLTQGASALGNALDLGSGSDCVTLAVDDYECGITDASTDFEADPIAVSLGNRDDNSWDRAATVWETPPAPVPNEGSFGGGAIISGGARIGSQ